MYSARHLEKKEIVNSMKELTARRVELIRSFYGYKTALKVHGELKKEKIRVYEGDRVKYFFSDHFAQVEKVVAAVARHPATFGKMLAEQSTQKLDSQS